MDDSAALSTISHALNVGVAVNQEQESDLVPLVRFLTQLSRSMSAASEAVRTTETTIGRIAQACGLHNAEILVLPTMQLVQRPPKTGSTYRGRGTRGRGS
jgi:hypothetical protein